MKPQNKFSKEELESIEYIEKCAKLFYNLDLNLKENVQRVDGRLYVVAKANPNEEPDFLKKYR